MTKSLRIAIVGYGKMGREIEKYAPESGCSVHVIIDTPDDWEKYADQLKEVDVAIEFTSPHVVIENLKRLMQMQVPVVTGTTGWSEHLEHMREFCDKSNGSLFYASNFSVGVNIFFALNRYLADLMKEYPMYRGELEEIHHIQKLDAPSGTAITMLDEILKINTGQKGWKFSDENPADGYIPVTAKRIEGVTGTHTFTYSSEIDTISIQHMAHNRAGFAKGALMAARWLKDKKGVFTMNDLLKL